MNKMNKNTDAGQQDKNKHNTSLHSIQRLHRRIHTQVLIWFQIGIPLPLDGISMPPDQLIALQIYTWNTSDVWVLSKQSTIWWLCGGSLHNSGGVCKLSVSGETYIWENQNQKYRLKIALIPWFDQLARLTWTCSTRLLPNTDYRWTVKSMWCSGNELVVETFRRSPVGIRIETETETQTILSVPKTGHLMLVRILGNR